MNSRLDIVVLPGGAGTIQTAFIPSFALSDRRGCLVLLDGDQQPNGPVPDPREVAESELSSAVERLLRGSPKLPLDGSHGEAAAGQREKQHSKILGWAYANLDFLPGGNPESLIVEMHPDHALRDGDSKKRWGAVVRTTLDREPWEPVTSEEILAEQKRTLAQVDTDHPSLRQIRERVLRLIRENP